MKNLFFFIFLNFALLSFAQTNKEIKYETPEYLGIKHYFDRSSDILKIYNQIKDSLHNGKIVDGNLKQGYSYDVIDTEVDLVERNNIFYNFTEVENYIYDVLKKAYPSVKPNLKIYVSKDSEMNASNIDDIMIVNIGLFNYIKTEAELASVLLHELGHNNYNHAYHRHIDWHYFQKKINRPKFGIPGYISASIMVANINKKMIQTESEADLFSIQKLRNSNYNIYAGLAVMNTFEELERLNKAQNDWLTFGSLKLKTHPTSLDRYIFSKNYIYNNPQKSLSQNFLVDSLMFKNIQEFARKQAFDNLMLNGQYKQCIVESFKLFLSNPDDVENLKYILKALKNKHVFSIKIDNLFLSENDKLGKFKDITNEKILTNVTTKYYNTNSENITKLKGYNELSSYTGRLKTYRDFIHFFANKAARLNCENCYFDVLLLSKSITKKDSLINDYLNENKSKNVILANYIQNEKVSLKKEMTYVNFSVPSSIKYKYTFSSDSNDFKKNEIAHLIPTYFKKVIEKKAVLYKNISSSDSLKIQTLEEERKIYNSAFIALSFEDKYHNRMASNPYYTFIYRSKNKWYLLNDDLLYNSIKDSIGLIKIFQIAPISIKYKKKGDKTFVKMLYYKHMLKLKIHEKNSTNKKVIFYKKCIRRKKFEVENPKVLFKNDKLFRINL